MPETHCGEIQTWRNLHGPKDKANRKWAMKWREPQLYLATKELEVIKSLFSLPIPGFFNIDCPSHACFMEHRIFYFLKIGWFGDSI